VLFYDLLKGIKIYLNIVQTSEDERQEVPGLMNDDFEFVEEDDSGLGKTWLVEYCLAYFQVC
jgi:hypothetical protein